MQNLQRFIAGLQANDTFLPLSHLEITNIPIIPEQIKNHQARLLIECSSFYIPHTSTQDNTDNESTPPQDNES